MLCMTHADVRHMYGRPPWRLRRRHNVGNALTRTVTKLVTQKWPLSWDVTGLPDYRTNTPTPPTHTGGGCVEREGCSNARHDPLVIR